MLNTKLITKASGNKYLDNIICEPSPYIDKFDIVFFQNRTELVKFVN